MIQAKPQLSYFYVSMFAVALVCAHQFWFLGTEYWFIEDWISKGPIIWAVSLVVIHRNLSHETDRTSITNLDLISLAVMLPVLGASLYFDPIIAPTLLVIYAWYLGSASTGLVRLLIVWLFLFFSLPFYSQTVPYLQSLTVLVTEYLLALVGIPVLVQEFQIAIPGGLFFVEEGCSGFSYMASNLLLLFLYSLMSHFNLRQFLLGLGVAVTMALLVNWIRVVAIILFAHQFGVDHDYVRSHGDFGWVLYALFLLPFFYGILKIDGKVWKD